MFKRQRTGSVVCASCGSLVGVNDDKCYSCGRRNPGLWGFGPMLRAFGNDLGFVALVVYGCAALYTVSLLITLQRGGNILGSGNPLDSVTRLQRAPGARRQRRRASVHVRHWWTVLSASWLHGSVLHILFNMLWVRQLVPDRGHLWSGRMIIIYTVAGATGFALSSTMGWVLWDRRFRSWRRA